MSFEDSFRRINLRTPIKNQSQLADFLGIKQPQISKQKKKNNFPKAWAYQIAKEYNLSTDWILDGEAKQNKSKDDFFLELEKWAKETAGGEDIEWLKRQIEETFPIFKQWKKRKNEKTAKIKNEQKKREK